MCVVSTSVADSPLYYGKSAGLFYVGNVMYSVSRSVLKCMSVCDLAHQATVITVCLQAAFMSSYWTWVLLSSYLVLFMKSVVSFSL